MRSNALKSKIRDYLIAFGCYIFIFYIEHDEYTLINILTFNFTILTGLHYFCHFRNNLTSFIVFYIILVCIFI